MGVHELWSILEPVRKSVPLYSLSGKTLAVDLSLWVCEAQHVQAMMGRVTKPHLRNLFFRVSALTLMGVKLVFVMEGEAPKIKAETMIKRTQGRFGGFQKGAAPKCTTNTNRGRFKAVLRECAEMLDYMGVPWVTAAGEAEAMCAYLDSQGLVDGCITNDGDAFLYGARTVYRNFNMNTKDPQVDCYKTSDVQKELYLSRENLVGLAIFLGCDYIPKGIQGVGKEQALRFIHTLEGQTLLQRFSTWGGGARYIPETTVKKVPHCNVCRHPGSAKAHEKGGCLLCDSRRFCEPQDFDYQCPCDWHRNEKSRHALSLETNIRKKTVENPLFPFTEIINEFLISKDKPVSHFQRRQPNMLLMQKFAYDKMEWPKHYTSEKVLVLMSYTNLINKKYGRDVSIQIKPLRILKPRVRNGVSCLEVVWTTPEHYVFPEDQVPENQDEVRTIEEESLFRLAYPEMVESYQQEKALAQENKTKKKKAKKKTADESDSLSDLLTQMTLQSSSNTETQPHKLPSTISEVNQSDVVVLTTSVIHEKQEKDDSSGLDECPGSPPVSHAESEDKAALSVSAVISALHLSDIDWESASFTSSPLPPANTSITVQPKPFETTHFNVNKTEKSIKEAKTLKAADAKLDSEQCYKERPLRQQVIMKNRAIQIDGKSIVSKQENKFTSLQNPNSDVSKNDYNAELSGNTIKKTAMKEDQSATNKAKLESYTLKQPMKHKNTCNAPPKAPQKYKFVKTTVTSFTVQERSHSDPGHSNKIKNKTEATKKSVCMSTCLSSDDSDAENLQDAPQRKTKAKSKKKSSYLSDILLKPEPMPKEVKSKTIDKVRSNSKEVGTSSISTKNKCTDICPEIIDEVFVQSAASPATDPDSDDSVICSDSPLPLAERLRLKFQK